MENVACHFVYYTGPRKGDAEIFTTARITIGKSGNSDFRLDPTADQVGSEHAEILLEDGNIYRLYDLGTKAGTYVNGERVHDRCTLLSEDYIRFSQDGPEIIFRVGTPPPGKQKLPLVFPVTAEMEFFSGSDAGRIFPINAAVTTNIGRRTELEIPLDPRGDMIVSGNHCNIRYVDGHFVLMDSSRNGTYVNGDLVDQPMEVIDGDVIMLGDGGPQARFHVDLAKRHYPNHRPLSPVARPVEPEKSAFSAIPVSPEMPVAPPVPVAPKAPDAILASAAPFATGTAPFQQAPGASKDNLSAPLDSDIDVPAPNATDSSLDRTTSFDDVDGEGEGDGDVGHDSHDNSTVNTPKENPAISEETTRGQAAPRRKFAMPAGIPLKHKLAFKPNPKLIIGAVAVAAAVGLFALLVSGDDDNGSSTGGRGDYAAALEKVQTVDNSPAGYKVAIPEGWTSIQNESTISAESTDKELALDYVRDPRLSEEKVRQMLSKDGAVVSPEVKNSQVGDVQVKILESTVGDVHRLAALHQPASGPPAAAMMETTNEVREKLDDEIVDKLLVQNLMLSAVAATPVPTVPTVAAANSDLPTPSAAQPTATPTAAVSPSPTPTSGVISTPTPAATTVAAGVTTEPVWGTKAMASKSLKLAVKIPGDWKGVSEEADAMLTLTDSSGLEIRVARDEGDLDPEGTFDAMVKEGWVKDGTLPSSAFQAAEFSKEDQNLLLVLVPEKAKTTLVLYATSSKDFTEQQRFSISEVIKQILPLE